MSVLVKSSIFSQLRVLNKQSVIQILSSNVELKFCTRLASSATPHLFSHANHNVHCHRRQRHNGPETLWTHSSPRSLANSFLGNDGRHVQTFPVRHFTKSVLLNKNIKGDCEHDTDQCTEDARKVGELPSGRLNAEPELSSAEGKLVSDVKRCIVFTCKVCSTRSAKLFSKVAYEKGIVLIRCPGCDNLHLIADNLGWFNHFEHRNIEQMMENKGEKVKKFTDIDGTVELTLEDITGLLNKPSSTS